jgi:hypothetical protein
MLTFQQEATRQALAQARPLLPRGKLNPQLQSRTDMGWDWNTDKGRAAPHGRQQGRPDGHARGRNESMMAFIKLCRHGRAICLWAQAAHCAAWAACVGYDRQDLRP